MKTITEDEAKEMYDDYLNEIGLDNLTALPPASTVLKRVDEIAYNCGFNDFVSNLEADKETEVDFS